MPRLARRRRSHRNFHRMKDYNRTGSVLQLLLSSRVFMAWFSIAVAFMAAAFAGWYNAYAAKPIIAVLASVVLYVAALRLALVRTANTLPAGLFAIAGLAFVLVYDRAHQIVEALLAAGCGLSLVAAILTFRQTRSVISALLLMVSSVIVLPFLLLGYNPYAVVTADYVRAVDGVPGIYYIECHGQQGLRDRFAIVIQPMNAKLDFLDRDKNFIGAKVSPDEPYVAGQYGVYSLRDRRFVIAQACDIDSIAAVGEGDFKMFDTGGRHFATFTLPKTPDDSLVIRPHFSEVQATLSDFLERAKDSEIDPRNNRFWRWMQQEDPHAYSMLCKIMAMSGAECSPANDLNYARAVVSVINADPYYKGDVDKALKDVDGLLEILGGGDQSDLNMCADLERLMESLRLSLEYDRVTTLGRNCYDEYVAWHNLMEAVVNYYEYVSYNSDWYSCKPMDMELEKMFWLRDRLRMLEVECKIISGRGTYSKSDLTLDLEDEDVLTYDDALEVLACFHSDKSPEYYHPMWNEIRPALEAWLSARRRISESLSDDRRADYDMTTKALESRFANIVCDLKKDGLVPILE